MENVDMQELKSKITQEVMQELEAKGIKVIPSVYDGDKEALKIMDKFDKQMEEYNEEKKRIMNRYSNQVATEKIAELNEKMLLNKGAAQEELDEIYNKQLHWRQEAIKNKQVSQEFKEMRRDTINLFMALKGSDLEADLVATMIGDLVEAKDITSLRIIQKLLGSNTFQANMLQRTIDSCNNYINDAELKSFIKQGKQYISTGKSNYTLKAMTYNIRNK